MKLYEIILIAVGLSMDAFAVSICKGMGLKKGRVKYAVIISLIFGLFQGVMPLIGFYITNTFVSYVSQYSSYIAFAILFIISLKMFYDAFFSKGENCNIEKPKMTELLLLGVATSIDALMIGVTFSLNGSANIILDCFIIALITFVVCFVGVFLGKKLGIIFGKYAQVLGAIVLLVLALNFLISELIK